MSKQAEREYACKVSADHLFRRPFDCPPAWREFAIILEQFLRRIPGGAILDLGCGPGWTSLFLAQAGFTVVGVDISERMIEIARQRSQRETGAVTFVLADMEELALARRDFDGVLLFDALHHCRGYERVLRGACEHLRSGGCLLLLEPSWLHVFSPHARAASRRFGVTELGFTRRRLRRALRRAGFQTVTHWYDPGPSYRGLTGFALANLRLWCGFLSCFPKIKQVVVAEK